MPEATSSGKRQMFNTMTGWFAQDKQQAYCTTALAAYSYVAGTNKYTLNESVSLTHNN